MRASLFVGDITDAPAEAICTSTNPRLSLMMGTGGAVRERGGWDILRACEALVDEQRLRTGHPFRAGTALATTAGNLPYKVVIHCIASNEAHLSSPSVVEACVRNALVAAERVPCSTVAMPVFAAGHARLAFRTALEAMCRALVGAQTSVQEVVVVVGDAEHHEIAESVLRDAGL